MRKDLETKIRNCGIYDTRNYRYVLREEEDENGWYEKIVRIHLEFLDTTATLDPENWETVKDYRKQS